MNFPLAGGVAATSGYGSWDRVTFNNTWTVGNWWVLKCNGIQVGDFTLGAGRLKPWDFSTCLTFSGRVYIGNGHQFNGCDIITGADDATSPTRWEEQNPGSIAVLLVTEYGVQDEVNALAGYQGKLAVFGRYFVQIWNVSGDPSLFSRSQVLPNTGTTEPLSVQSLGDLDVLFVNPTGVRSLRVRDSSGNAFVADLGSPVDLSLQPLLLAGLGHAACGIVDPSTGRYWVFVKDRLYTYSYFPSSKVLAWSTYMATYDDGNGVQVAFVPAKFTLYGGSVYAVTVPDGGGNVKFIRYSEYSDGCVAVAELPWLDMKSPQLTKDAEGVLTAMAGQWTIEAGLDPASGRLAQVYAVQNPTGDPAKDSPFNKGVIPLGGRGSHFKIRATTAAGWQRPATLGSLVFEVQ